MEPGRNYLVTTNFMSGNGRRYLKQMVATFVAHEDTGPDGPQHIFSLRPLAGTQTIPDRDIVGEPEQVEMGVSLPRRI